MTGWRVHAWVLLSNHYHLMIETPEASLIAGMQWVQNTLTRRFNVRHRAWGRVFGDRYKAVLVEGRQRFFYETLMDYIHLNPVRARLVRLANGESILDYRWSSLTMGYAVPPRRGRRGLSLLSTLPHIRCESVKSTIQRIYVRFHGPQRWYRHDYSPEELAEWARRIRASGASRVWAYFNNDRDCYAVSNARELRGQLGG